MKVFERNLRLLRAAGFSPTALRVPTDEDPEGILALAAPDRLYAVWSDEHEPGFVRVTTGMGFAPGEAPEEATLLRLANEANRASRFVRTAVEGRHRVEFSFEAALDDPEGLPRAIEAALPALARVADDFFERMYLPGPGSA